MMYHMICTPLFKILDLPMCASILFKSLFRTFGI